MTNQVNVEIKEETQNEFLSALKYDKNQPLFSTTLDDEYAEIIAENINLVDETTYKKYLRALAFRLSEILVKTLGPYARTTIIDDGVAKYPTKDGWNILKRIKFNDQFLNALHSFIKDISFNLVTKVGDGTTTALVSACNFIKEFDEAKIRVRQPELIAALQNVYNAIKAVLSREGDFVKYIDKSPNSDFDDIYKIALLSSNGNEEIARVVQDIYKQTHNPNIYVSIDKQEVISYEITSGYKLDCRPINQKFYRNDGDNLYLPQMPVLIFDHNVSSGFDGAVIGTAQKIFTQSGKHRILGIIAPNFDDQFLEWMGANLREAKQQGAVPDLIFIQANMATTQGKKYVEDMVKISNAEILSYNKVTFFNDLVNPTEENQSRVNDILKTLGDKYGNPSEFIELVTGNVHNVKITEKAMVVDMDVENNPVLQQHIEEVNNEFEEATKAAEKSLSGNTHTYTNLYLHHSRLSGGMGVIKVGGVSDIERLCDKDAIDDAVLACKSAFEHGYARGMNISTINAIRVVIDEDNAKRVANAVLLAHLKTFCANECKTGDDVKALEKRIQKEVINKAGELVNFTNGDGEELNGIMYQKTLPSLEIEILEMLDKVFVSTVYQIFRNKIEDSGTCGKVMTNGDAEAVKRIINVCCTTGCTYNLISEEYEPFELDKISVINPIETDIQVLNAIIGFLTLILTSNQMLTLNKFLGMKESKAKMKKDAIDNQMDIVREYIKVLKEEFPDASPAELISALNIG